MQFITSIMQPTEWRPYYIMQPSAWRPLNPKINHLQESFLGANRVRICTMQFSPSLHMAKAIVGHPRCQVTAIYFFKLHFRGVSPPTKILKTPESSTAVLVHIHKWSYQGKGFHSCGAEGHEGQTITKMLLFENKTPVARNNKTRPKKHPAFTWRYTHSISPKCCKFS